MDRIKNRLREERIDFVNSIRPMSYNVPGHEDRMKAHCERINNEYQVNLDKIKQANSLLYRAAALFREIPTLPNDIYNSKSKVIEDIKNTLKTSRELRGVFK